MPAADQPRASSSCALLMLRLGSVGLELNWAYTLSSRQHDARPHQHLCSRSYKPGWMDQKIEVIASEPLSAKTGTV